MAKMTGKQALKTLGLGMGVVILTPFIAGFIGGFGFLGNELIPGIISWGTALSSGLAAWGIDTAITKWWK